MSQSQSFDAVKRDSLARLLSLRVQWLRYIEVALCVKRVLEFSGYHRVTLSDRWTLQGRTKSGGIDIHAMQDTGLGLVPVIVQVRHRKSPIARHDVDALRALCLREQVPFGILIATRTIGRAARETAAAYPGCPIRVMDGAELGGLMRDAGLGVLEQRDLATGQVGLHFDELQFELLIAHCAHHWPPKKRKEAA